MISLKRLFRNTFEGHKGIPGHQGGSLPKSGGSARYGQKGGAKDQASENDPRQKGSWGGSMHVPYHEKQSTGIDMRKVRKWNIVSDSDILDKDGFYEGRRTIFEGGGKGIEVSFQCREALSTVGTLL